MTILTTICYLKAHGKTLMLYRNKKENDINEGKWIGIGGKLEKGESPYECIIREFYEETGLTIVNPILKGYITFPGIYHGEDEGMFLYVATEYRGSLQTECSEGELAWVDDNKLDSLPMWEGDRYFETWLHQDGFHEVKLVYENDKLIEKKVNHY